MAAAAAAFVSIPGTLMSAPAGTSAVVTMTSGLTTAAAAVAATGAGARRVQPRELPHRRPRRRTAVASLERASRDGPGAMMKMMAEAGQTTAAGVAPAVGRNGIGGVFAAAMTGSSGRCLGRVLGHSDLRLNCRRQPAAANGPPGRGSTLAAPRMKTSGVALAAHQSPCSTVELKAGGGGGRKSGTRGVNRPSRVRGRGGGSVSGKPEAGGGGGAAEGGAKNGRGVRHTPEGATWRDAELDAKSRSFLFVKEIKAIPKWNGGKVMRVLTEARRLSEAPVSAPLATNGGSGSAAVAPIAEGPGGGDGDLSALRPLEITSFMYNACITHMSTSGRWQEALEVLDLMREAGRTDEFCVTAAITACGRAGQWKKSLDLLDELKADGGRVTLRLMNAVVDACRKGRQWQIALEKVAEMKEAGVTPDDFTYTAAIAACRQGGQWEKALELFRDMPASGVQITSAHYNVAIAICGEGKQPERAVEIFREMQEAGNGMRYDVNRVSYNTAMIACGEGGSWELALGLFREMAPATAAPPLPPLRAREEEKEDTGGPPRRRRAAAIIPTPDLISYNTIINVCKKVGPWEEAVGLLREMSIPVPGRAAAGGGSGGGVLVPNVVTYTAALVACARGGRWDKAVELFREMEEVGITPDVVSYNAAISASGLAGRWEEGLSLLEEMPGKGVKPGNRTYSTAMLLCGRCGQLRTGLDVLRKTMPGHGATPNALNYSAASVICAVGKDWGAVVEVFGEMAERRVVPNAACLTDLVVVGAKTGQWEELLETLGKLVEAGGLLPEEAGIAQAAALAARKCGKSQTDQLALVDLLVGAKTKAACASTVATVAGSASK